MIVEFIGPSGAGKTTLIAGVMRRLSERGIAVRSSSAFGTHDLQGRRLSPNQQRVDRVVALASNPRLALWCMTNALDAADSTSTDRIRRLLWLCRSVRFQKGLRRRSGLHLLDEGPCKVAVALLAEGSRRPDALLRMIPWPDLCVALTADPRVTVDRVRKRGAGAPHLSDETILHWSRTYRNGAALLPSRIPVFEADTSEDEDYSGPVADWIESAYRIAMGLP